MVPNPQRPLKRMSKIEDLNNEIVACQRCPRLVQWCADVAVRKRKSYEDDAYWGKAVPSFGDPDARVLLVGLAPGAHGANRTGRMFTGDRSGEWLYRALHRAEFANQAESIWRDDGLTLHDAWITAVVHCAPPDNKPSTEERNTCVDYLGRELPLMPRTRVIVALGGVAWNGALKALAANGHQVRPKPKFGHAAEFSIGPYILLGSYHPSQQNTSTKRLTEPMLDAIFNRAKEILK
jgi:uracil-DNA glycosylase family 4